MVTRRLLLQGTAAGLASGLLPVSSRRAWAQSGSVRIGVVESLSGVGAPNGEARLKGIQVAADQVNRKGGVLGRPLELVIRDDKYTGSGAAAAARELAGDGVNLMIAGSQTVTALALLPILEQLDAVAVGSSAAGMQLTKELYSPNYFRTCANNYTTFTGLGAAIAQTFPEIKKWHVVAFDNDYGRDCFKLFSAAVKEHAKKRGNAVAIAEPTYSAPSAADYSISINQIMNSDAEGVFVALVGAAAITFFQQARAVGLDRKVKAFVDVGTETLIAKAMKSNLPQNFHSLSFWVPASEAAQKNPLSRQLYEDYVAKFKDPNPNGLVIYGHRALVALTHGIEKAASTDTEAVIKAMEGLEFETPIGPYRIRKEDHQGIGSIFLSHIVPKQEDPFYEFADVIPIDEGQVVDPASPGKAMNG